MATTASTRTGLSGVSASRVAARLWPATAAVPWPVTRTRWMLPSRSRARSSSGSVSGPSSTAARPSRSVSRPRRVLRNEAGASVISFSRKCGKSPRSMSRVVISAVSRSLGGDGQLGAVVGQPTDALDRPRPGPVEDQDLAPAGRRVLRVGGRLAVHAHVGRGLLDQPVGLTGHDEGVLGQPDVEGLAAPPQGQVQPLRSHAVGGRDGHRALEGGHRAPECLVEVVALRQATGSEGRDHLGVGGDLGRDHQALLGPQVGVVVDVAVEGGGDVGRVDPVGLLAAAPGGRWARR